MPEKLPERLLLGLPPFTLFPSSLPMGGSGDVEESLRDLETRHGPRHSNRMEGGTQGVRCSPRSGRLLLAVGM